jgi:hypothetical protein
MYFYDHADRQESLSLQIGTSPAVPLVGNGTYKPFGPLTSLDLGNGLHEARDYGTRYLPTTIRVDGANMLLHWSYAKDAVSTKGFGAAMVRA